MKELTSDFIDTLKNNYKSIILNSAYIWLIFPILKFLFWSLIVVIRGIEKLDFEKLGALFVDSVIPWYVSILQEPFRQLFNFMLILIVVTIYYIIMSYIQDNK